MKRLALVTALCLAAAPAAHAAYFVSQSIDTMPDVLAVPAQPQWQPPIGTIGPGMTGWVPPSPQPQPRQSVCFQLGGGLIQCHGY